MRNILAALVSLAVAVAQPATPVRIQVINSLTKAPLAGASVTVDSAGLQNSAKITGRTGDNGVLEKNSPFFGSALITVRIHGFRMIGGGMMGKIAEIQNGKPSETTVEMLPLGVLAGRVLDQYGDPVRHAIVSTLQTGNDAEPYRSLFAATTDDLGEYRIADVEPGSYHLAVEYTSRDEHNYTRQSRYQWPEFGGLILFPDASDFSHAQQVKVGSGETVRLADGRLPIERSVTISGHLKPGKTDGAMISAQRAGPRINRHQPGAMSTHIAADGSFNIEVLPGEYTLKASDRSGKISPSLTVDARDKNITGVELALGPGYQISGRIVVDGPTRQDFSKVILNFMSEPVKIDSSGTFHTTAPDSKVRYIIQGLPEDWYVKDVRVLGRSIAGRNLELAPGESDVLFTLSPKGGRVEIFPERTDPGASEPAMCALLPEDGIVDVNSMLAAQRGADLSANFVFHSVPPGSYRVFLLDVSNFTWLFRPDVLLEKYRNLAPLIIVTEGEQKRTTVRLTKLPEE